MLHKRHEYLTDDEDGCWDSLFVFLNRWYESEGRARFEEGKDLNGENIGDERRSALGVVDLACGRYVSPAPCRGN